MECAKTTSYPGRVPIDGEFIASVNGKVEYLSKCFFKMSPNAMMEQQDVWSLGRLLTNWALSGSHLFFTKCYQFG